MILCAALIWAQVPQNTHFFGQVPPIIQHHQIYPQEIQAIPQVHPPKNKAFDGGAVFATNLLKVRNYLKVFGNYNEKYLFSRYILTKKKGSKILTTPSAWNVSETFLKRCIDKIRNVRKKVFANLIRKF